MMLLLDPTPFARGLAGKKVEVFFTAVAIATAAPPAP
jgi:hypothetical protein